MAAHLPQDAPFRFLDLPFDVREHVYLALLALQDPTPVDPKLQLRHTIPAVHDHSEPFIHAIPAHPTPTTSGLLLTSRQIHSEVVCVVERRSRRASHSPSYTLDVLASGSSIYPTWISYPAPRKYLSRVHVVFRMDEWVGRPSPLGFGNDSAITLLEGLVQLLSEFLVYGPTFVPTLTSSSDRALSPMALNEVSIEFIRQRSAGTKSFNMSRLLDSIDPNEGCVRTYTHEEELEGASDGLDDALLDVDGTLTRFAESGLLWGRVKKFSFKFEEWSKEWDVVECEPEEVRKVTEEMAEIGWKSMANIMDHISGADMVPSA